MKVMKEKKLAIREAEVEANNRKVIMKLIATNTSGYFLELLVIHNKLLEDGLSKIFK